MIKFFNFEPEKLENISAAFPKYAIDNACLVQSPTGRIFQVEGRGLSLIIGKKEKQAVFECEETSCDFLETADAVIANFAEGCVAVCDGKDYIYFIFADGTSATLTLEEFDYTQNISKGYFGGINLPILNIKISYANGKYEIDTTHAACLIE